MALKDGTEGYFIKQIGQNRGAPRIWLEGKQIERAGMGPGDKFDIHVEGQMITLKATEDGTRTISQKQKGERVYPVIDINSAELLKMFDGMDAVRMIVRKGEVVFVPMASEMKKRERYQRIAKKLANNEPLHVASAFHGAGLLSRAIHDGFARQGVKAEAVFLNEIREDLIEHAATHNSAVSASTLLIGAPSQELVQDEWMMSQMPRVDVLEMGIPCSGASVAGRAKRNLEKPEDHPEVGHLCFAALVIVMKTQPACLLMENVPQYANTASASILRYQLRDMGYDVHEAVLKGQDFGCLEHRERWCMVAVTKGLQFSFDQLVPRPSVVKTLGDVLEEVSEDDPRWSEMAGLKAKQERDIAAGKGFRMQVFGPEDTKIATITKGYAKVRSTDPKIRHPSNPNLLRQLSPLEHARIKLQGAPESVVKSFIGEAPATLVHELLGQGILYEPFAQTSESMVIQVRDSVRVRQHKAIGTQARKSALKVG